VNNTLFPKEDYLPDRASWDNEVKKGVHVEYVTYILQWRKQVDKFVFTAGDCQYC
jgi:hypothetical protein